MYNHIFGLDKQQPNSISHSFDLQRPERTESISILTEPSSKECTTCHASFSRSALAIQHETHSHNYFRLQCCGMKFVSESEYQRHLSTAHGEDQSSKRKNGKKRLNQQTSLHERAKKRTKITHESEDNHLSQTNIARLVKNKSMSQRSTRIQESHEQTLSFSFNFSENSNQSIIIDGDLIHCNRKDMSELFRVVDRLRNRRIATNPRALMNV